jgi:hypothetical protein
VIVGSGMAGLSAAQLTPICDERITSLIDLRGE